MQMKNQWKRVRQVRCKWLRQLYSKWLGYRMNRRHKWLTVADTLPADKRAAILRGKLHKVEAQILKKADHLDTHHWVFDKKRVEQIDDLLSDRCYLLNQMFRATPDEVERFGRINDMLYRLTQKLHAKTASVYRELIKSAPDPEFDDDIEVEGFMLFDHSDADSVLRLDDDDYYGSDFDKILDIYSCILRDDWRNTCWVFKSFSPEDTPEMSDAELGIENSLDDGTTWAEGWLRNPALDHICICHTVHDICTHKHFSIPDFLRLNDFWCEVTVKNQHLVAQDGSHKPLY